MEQLRSGCTWKFHENLSERKFEIFLISCAVSIDLVWVWSEKIILCEVLLTPSGFWDWKNGIGEIRIENQNLRNRATPSAIPFLRKRNFDEFGTLRVLSRSRARDVTR